MAKHLKDILGESFLKDILEVYTPFPEDERRFYAKHGLELGKEGEPPIKFPRFPNIYSEAGKHNADQLFNGSTKPYDREANRYGYNPGNDQEHYEAYDEKAVDKQLDKDGVKGKKARKLTHALLKGRSPQKSKESQCEENIEEATKKLKSYENGHMRADVHHDKEWDEYRVKLYSKGKHLKAADYHTDDKDDAHGTAKLMVKAK